AQVVDIVDVAKTVTDVDQLAQHIKDVTLVQHARASIRFTTQATVELHATNAGQVVAVFSEEQVVEQRFGSLFGGRLARTHHAIDLDQRLELGTSGIQLEGVRDEGTT